MYTRYLSDLNDMHHKFIDDKHDGKHANYTLNLIIKLLFFATGQLIELAYDASKIRASVDHIKNKVT